MNTSLEDIRILCDTDIEADIKELDYNQKLQYLIDLSNKVGEHLEMLEKVLEEVEERKKEIDAIGDETEYEQARYNGVIFKDRLESLFKGTAIALPKISIYKFDSHLEFNDFPNAFAFKLENIPVKGFNLTINKFGYKNTTNIIYHAGVDFETNVLRKKLGKICDDIFTAQEVTDDNIVSVLSRMILSVHLYDNPLNESLTEDQMLILLLMKSYEKENNIQGRTYNVRKLINYSSSLCQIEETEFVRLLYLLAYEGKFVNHHGNVGWNTALENAAAPEYVEVSLSESGINLFDHTCK